MYLPYWNANLDLTVSTWFPLGIDYESVAINSLYSEQLEKVASLALVVGSELLCMTSIHTGSIGSLLRERTFASNKHLTLDLGFAMVFGYSKEMEKITGDTLNGPGALHSVKAGITTCCIWRDEMLLDSLKTIVIVSEDIFFDEKTFLADFACKIETAAKEKGSLSIPYYAQEFGFRRFYIPYETDDPTDLCVSRLLTEMEFAETSEIVGPSPEMDFPLFMGASIVVS